MNYSVNKNKEQFDKSIQLIRYTQNAIQQCADQFIEYLQLERDEIFLPNPTYEYSKNYKKGEAILDRLDELRCRNSEMRNMGKNCFNLLENIRNHLQLILDHCNNDIINIDMKNNEVVTKLLELLESSISEQIAEIEKEIKEYCEPLQRQIEEFTKERTEKIEQLKQRLEYEKIELQSKLTTNQQITQRTEEKNELKELEIELKRKVDKVLFDSNESNWDTKRSVFDSVVADKEKLIFHIETKDGHKFGCYINEKIHQISTPIIDKNCFVYRLYKEKNGNLKTKIYQLASQMQGAPFVIHSGDGNDLFYIGRGNDILIKKKSKKNECKCKGYSFRDCVTRNNMNVLSRVKDGNTFEVKRIVVYSTIDIFN